MRKTLFLRIAAVAAFLLCLCFAVSCEPKNDQTKSSQTEHRHSCKTVSVTPPTCAQKGYTTYTCETCGDSYRDDYVAATGHKMKDGVCTVCGGSDSGLSYTLCSDRRSYLVSVGDSADEKIVVPAEHEGKPVVGVAAGGFSGCTALREITLPESVYMIGEKAFYHCRGLTAVAFEGALENIDASAFAGCTGLEEIDLSGGTLSIGEKTFSGCDRLERVLWSEDLETVSAEAFSGCVKLASVCLSRSVTKIAATAFRGCSLVSVSVREENETYYSVNNCLVQRDTKTLILGTAGGSIPSDGSVTAIGAYAFADNPTLESVFVPAAVEKLGKGVFWGCAGLTEVAFAEDSRLKMIDAFAFRDCTALPTVILPDSVETLGEFTFMNCTSLTEVGLPASLTALPYQVFVNCTSLVRAEIPSGVQKIGDSAFQCCTSLAHVRIPASVSKIGMGAFDECRGLTSFMIEPGSALRPGSMDTYFWDCSGLTELGGPLWLIEHFHGNYSKILSITVNDEDILDSNSFGPYENLTSVTVSGNVKTIGSNAFAHCDQLRSVTISGDVNRIEYNAFAGCGRLSSVTFENTEGWYYKDSVANVTDAAENARLLTSRGSSGVALLHR